MAGRNKERERRWVRNALVDSLARIEDRNSLEDIIIGCSFGFKVDCADIIRHSTWWIDATARQIAMVLCLRFTRLGTAEIGRGFGRDHTCVICARRLWDDLIDEVFAACRIKAPRRPPGWRVPRPRKIKPRPYAGKERNEVSHGKTAQ